MLAFNFLNNTALLGIGNPEAGVEKQVLGSRRQGSGVESQIGSFKQLFIRSTDATLSNSLPQKMTIDDLVNLISDNKIEVFINHQNQMVNVTSFFKPNMLLETAGMTHEAGSTRQEVRAKANNKQLTVNDKFIEFNLLDENKGILVNTTPQKLEMESRKKGAKNRKQETD